MRSKQRNYDSGSPCRSVRAYGPAGAVSVPTPETQYQTLILC